MDNVNLSFESTTPTNVYECKYQNAYVNKIVYNDDVIWKAPMVRLFHTTSSTLDKMYYAHPRQAPDYTKVVNYNLDFYPFKPVRDKVKDGVCLAISKSTEYLYASQDGGMSWVSVCGLPSQIRGKTLYAFDTYTEGSGVNKVQCMAFVVETSQNILTSYIYRFYWNSSSIYSGAYFSTDIHHTIALITSTEFTTVGCRCYGDKDFVVFVCTGTLRGVNKVYIKCATPISSGVQISSGEYSDIVIDPDRIIIGINNRNAYITYFGATHDKNDNEVTLHLQTLSGNQTGFTNRAVYSTLNRSFVDNETVFVEGIVVVNNINYYIIAIQGSVYLERFIVNSNTSLRLHFLSGRPLLQNSADNRWDARVIDGYTYLLGMTYVSNVPWWSLIKVQLGSNPQVNYENPQSLSSLSIHQLIPFIY